MKEVKATTSITVDAELLTKARKEGLVISKWVNDKLKEYMEAMYYPDGSLKGELAKVKNHLTSEEAKLLYLESVAHEEAVKAENEEAQRVAEAQMLRIANIHTRLNQLTEDKSHAINPIAVSIITEEQVKLHKELQEMLNGTPNP